MADTTPSCVRCSFAVGAEERNWNIRVPGYSRDDIRAPKPKKITDLDKQRAALVQKDAGNTAKRRKMD